ncbi:MAG: hypothetical protein LC663_04885, partial [Actinobacteria bacterium]|nr:hypothetical protein [Actinomycetota bacterium]
APSIACDAGATCRMTSAINDAMNQWDLAFAGSHVCSPLCLSNGPNTIGWAPLGAGTIALTTLTYSSKNVISHVQVQLNSTLPWRFAAGQSTVKGAGADITAGEGFPGQWCDVESLLLHELGHAIGLDHPGTDPTAAHAQPWPSNLMDTPSYQQVMYGWYFRGSIKQTLREGDILGAQRVATDSFAGHGSAPGDHGENAPVQITRTD